MTALAHSTEHTTIHVQGLCCATEEALIRKRLASLSGIRDMQFNVLNHQLTVAHTCGTEPILRALSSIGLPGDVQAARQKSKSLFPARQAVFTAVSGLAFATGLVLDAMNMPAEASLSAYLLSIGIGGWKIALKGVLAVRHGALDMNFLMTAAVAGALAIGHPAEGAAVIFLFAVSLLLESMSVERGRRALQTLLNLSPPTATIRMDESERTLPVGDVKIGAIMMIRPGERIPLDGTVIAGHSSVDQSAITGESLPVAAAEGTTVFAGSLNQRGFLDVRVTKASSESTLAHIVQLIEEAQNRKAPVQTFVERFARYYTPSVFGVAIMLAILPPLAFQGSFDVWFYRSLVLLVIACPCALVISTPVTVVSALTRAARAGILVKGGNHLERLASVRAVALDKTGTLTVGAPLITDVFPVDSRSPREIIRLAAALELRSEHHLADAFLRKADSDNIPLDDLSIDQFETLPGRGVKARIGREIYWVGNHALVEELGQCSDKVESLLSNLEIKGKTAVVLVGSSGPLGVIGIADQLRTESHKMIRSLHEQGVETVTLLTGDNKNAAERVARELGVDGLKYELMPEDKLTAVDELRSKHGVVAMVGDGINDGPALAAADVGIAMGVAGSDTALETSDVVLMSDNLMRIPDAIRLGKKALSIIRQNVFAALFVKALFLGLGIAGLSSLWLAILADDGVTLLVILNSLRLLRNTDRTIPAS